MPGSCEVCSSEPSKYRYLLRAQATSPERIIYTNRYRTTRAKRRHKPRSNRWRRVRGDQSKPASIAASPELTELFRRHPNLRDQLHEIYQSTLEDEWVEWYTPPSRGRFNGRGGRGGRAPTRRSRGPWTSEKGFNRGVGRVRKFRQDCEEGSETGAGAEAFMRFWALVNNSQDCQPEQSRSSS
ncbi:hypothetical protein N7509_003402 [Penicillium cosmopolitanum]|uniref:Uncharacterized protein n=1 Tax=Penicillium cosmopolitanum TaxID=1131564 RepID=A0A9W9W4Z2_9EURO|nr:uncharacterized protein N7509_003402 [Penicillium cosmopolitanum]KAJ5403531.1 hypothetical protein N7509_003402 [Penicillium cosmopolitanum]